MKAIDKKRWFIKDNELSISLMNFYVRINICNDNQDLYYILRVFSDNQELLKFNFYTLEDAVLFTEDFISKSRTKEEVNEKYEELLFDNKITLPESKRNSIQDNTMFLLPEEIDQAIIEYFGNKKEYRVSCREELLINKGNPDISFYLIEHLQIDGIKRDISTLLTTKDLQKALNSYVNFYGYELIDFKYVGGVHRVGYFFDEDTPYFEGINLSVKQKDNGKAKMLVKT